MTPIGSSCRKSSSQVSRGLKIPRFAPSPLYGLLRIPIGGDITDNFTHGLSETNVAYDADLVRVALRKGTRPELRKFTPMDG